MKDPRGTIVNKRLVIGLFVLMQATHAAAEIPVGIEAGVSFAEYSFDSPEHLPLPRGNYGANVNGRAALRSRIPVRSQLAVLSGLSYETNGIDIQFLSFDDDVPRDAVQTTVLDYLTVPLLLEATLPGDTSALFVRAGVEFDVLFDAEDFVTIDGHRFRDADTDDLYPRVDWSLTSGVGVRLFQRADIHIAYRRGLRNINSGLNRDEHRFYNQAVTLGLTYWLSEIP